MEKSSSSTKQPSVELQRQADSALIWGLVCIVLRAAGQAIESSSTANAEKIQMKTTGKKPTKRKPQRFPPGWNEKRVREVIAHYDGLTEEEWLAEDEAARNAAGPDDDVRADGAGAGRAEADPAPSADGVRVFSRRYLALQALP